MIKKLNYIAENDVLMTYDLDGSSESLLFSDIHKYWDYATYDDFEFGSAWVLNDIQILFTFLVAKGQGGIVAIWNAKDKTVDHISEAAFCIYATVNDNMIYQLKEVSFYAMPTHYIVESIPVGVKDHTMKGDQLYCQEPRKIALHDSKAKLAFEGSKLFVATENEKVLFVDDVNNRTFRECSKSHQHLYEMLEVVQKETLETNSIDKYNQLKDMLL